MSILLKDKINRVYVSSINTEELLSAYKEISSTYLENPTVKNFIKTSSEYEKEYNVYESLSFRLNAKYLVLKYLNGYTEQSKDEALKFITASLDIAADKGYMKTAKILANARDFITDIHELIFEAAASIARVRDSSGELATNNVSLVREVYSVILNTLEKSKSLASYKLFPEEVYFPDPVQTIIKDINEECEWFRCALSSCNDAVALAIMKECVSPIEASGCMTSASFYESADRSKISSKTIVISSPFADEAILYAGVFSSTARPMHVLHAERLLDYVESGFNAEEFFLAVAEKNIDLLIMGVEKLGEKLLDDICVAILKASHHDSHFIVYDSIGGRALYERFDKAASETEGVSPFDVHHVFLTMPSYKAVTRLLADGNYISDNESSFEKIKQSLPFMGFVGLNRILASSPSSDWLAAAELRSRENSEKAMPYLTQLIAPRQLIDDGWGNFSGHVRFVSGNKKSFDYDDIHGIDKENIKKIMEKNGISTFDRCGLIVKYCLLSGNDVSIWKNLSDVEKSRRATMATTLVARVLDTSYAPRVEIVPDNEWDRDGAGGVCVDGGKRIIYRASSVENYSWMEDAVCHECFHAFQHTALSVPFAEWFFTELGVTEGRIASWDDNFKVYSGTEDPKIYRVEIVECDARAFALDCLRNIENHWKDIDFN